MTEEQLKEQLAFYYFCLLASKMLCKVKTGNLADGTDVEIEPTIEYIQFGKTRHFSVGKTIEVQLKTTTTESVIFERSQLRYDLKIKNYNDLIFRRNYRSENIQEATPLILVLLVLKGDGQNWIEIKKEEKLAVFNGSFYWYLPSEELDFSKNKSQHRINIPLKNEIDLSFFKDIFNLLYL